MNKEVRKALLADGFFSHDNLQPSDKYDGEQFLCVCLGWDKGIPYWFYECRVWSDGFFFDDAEARGEKSTAVMYFKPLMQLKENEE